MGVDICIYANHQIRGKTFAERICEFVEKLETKIQFLPNTPYDSEKEPPKTTVAEDVVYYIRYEYSNAENDFNRGGRIDIETNYQYLRGFELLGQTMWIFPLTAVGTRYSRWVDMLGNLGIYNNPYSAESVQTWLDFQQFQSELVKKLGGNKVVYIDDYSFQIPESLFFEGKSMEEVFPELEKKATFYEFGTLLNDYKKLWWDDEISGFHGFYEDIK